MRKGSGMERKLKVGVHRGAGPPPGYRWNVVLLDQAVREARVFLSEDQYGHLSDQVRHLAEQVDPTHPAGLSVDAVEDFFELREKGGPLGKLNVRLFFFLDKKRKRIVVIGSFKKENNGPTPMGAKITMRRRKRLYEEDARAGF